MIFDARSVQRDMIAISHLVCDPMRFTTLVGFFGGERCQRHRREAAMLRARDLDDRMQRENPDHTIGPVVLEILSEIPLKLQPDQW